MTNVKIQKHIEQAIEDALGAQRAQVRYIVIQQLLPIAQYEATDDSEIVTETVERPIYDNEGNETGEVETRKFQVVRHNDTANSTNRKAIAGLKQNEKGVIEVKYHDKLKALELLGRYGGLWNDKLEVTGAGGGPIEHIDYSNMSEEEARKKYLELLQDRQ